MYGIFVLGMGYLSYVWGNCLMLGDLPYVWDISLMFWKKSKSQVLGTKYLIPSTKIKITSHPGATVAECIVLWLGYLSYVWDISFISGVLVLWLGYKSYVLEKIKITCHPGATMGEGIVFMFWIFVLCLGY